jgi:hypothetical protein
LIPLQNLVWGLRDDLIEVREESCTNCELTKFVHTFMMAQHSSNRCQPEEIEYQSDNPVQCSILNGEETKRVRHVHYCVKLIGLGEMTNAQQFRGVPPRPSVDDVSTLQRPRFSASSETRQ